MKKKLVVFLSFIAVLLAGCFDSKGQITKIEGENISLAKETFNNQVDEFQYIKDLEDFLSYNILSLTEDKPFVSDFSFSVDFNEDSSVQGGVKFSQNKISKSHNLESADISVEIIAEKQENDTEPFNLSGSVSLLYKNDEMYANLHDLDVFMGEGNMVAKMYTLLGDLLVDNWVNLEVHSGGVVSINEEENKKLPYILGTIKNVLRTENIESSPDFLGSVVELIDIVNSYVDLGISVDELKLSDYNISYSELLDNTIQKEFTGSFQGKNSSFDMYFLASKEGLDLYLYNIKEYDEDVQNYREMDTEFKFLLQEKGKSRYSLDFQSEKSQQKVIDLQGNIEVGDNVIFYGDFVLEPLEIVRGQKISGEINGSVTKKSGESDREFPELTGKVFSLSELLSSL